MPHLYQNDFVNIRADQEMLHYLHKRTWRGKRTLFQKRSPAVRNSAVAVKSCIDSLNRQINGDLITPVDEMVSPRKKEETQRNSQSCQDDESSESFDLQRETIRYTSKPVREEGRQSSPVEEEAQSLLRLFLNNSKDSLDIPVEKSVESTPNTSQHGQSLQKEASNNLEPDRTHEPFAEAVNESIQLYSSYTASSKENTNRKIRQDENEISNSRKRRASEKLVKASENLIKVSEMIRDQKQPVKTFSQASSTSVQTKQNEQQSFKEAPQEKVLCLTERKPDAAEVDEVKNRDGCLFTLNMPSSRRDPVHLSVNKAEPKHQKGNVKRSIPSDKKFTIPNSLLFDKEESDYLSQNNPVEDTFLAKHQPAANKNPRPSFLNIPSRKPSKATHTTSSNTPTIDENQSDAPQSMASKRPRRANATPVNYCLKRPRFSSHSEPEGVDVTVRAPGSQGKAEVSVPESLPSSQEPIVCRPRVVHSSETSMIQKGQLLSPVINFLQKPSSVPYRNRDSREEIIQSYKDGKVPPEKLNGTFIHVDFDRDEQEAVFSLISTINSQEYNTVDTDMMIQDRIIQAAKASNFNTASMADRIDKMSRLHCLLSKDKSEPEQLLLNAKRGKDVLSKNDSQAASMLLNRIAGLTNSGSTLTATMEAIGENYTMNLVKQLPRTNSLRRRKARSVERFLIDAQNGHLSTTPWFLRVFDPQRRSGLLGNMRHIDGPSALIRSREIGNQHYTTPRIVLDRRVQDTKIQQQRYWKGASNDVVVLSWSPDGTRFAAGATAQSDTHNMIYNRGNNLVLGDLTNDRLDELPDHWIPRPSANDISDPKLYMSVSAVRWAHHEDKLFTASYDKTVKLWDVANRSDTRCIHTFPHPAKVQVMALSQYHNSLLAVGHDSGLQSFGLWNMAETPENISRASYTDLNFDNSYPSKKIELLPSSLVWGTSFSSKDYLVAGMSSNRIDGNADPARDGFLTAWHTGESSLRQIQFSPKSQNIFDIAWHPTLPYFATGSSIPISGRARGIGKSTRSLVRLYAPHHETRLYEFECPALDMNDVSYCAANINYISASCTDGNTYIWDYRKGDKILHKLSHGDPLSELDAGMTREQADVGVRVALWGNSTDRLYTGSSDGVLKSWNILRAPEDAHIQDIVSLGAEIMSGSFSPDGTNILLGDACGGIHLLSACPFSSNSETGTFDFIGAADKMSKAENEPENVGIEAAREYLATGQLAQDPRYGPGQGPNYSGPYAAWARPAGTHPAKLAETSLREEIQKEQLDHKVSSLPGHRKRQACQAEIKVKKRRHDEPKELKKREIINLITDDEDEEDDDDETLLFISSIRRRTFSPAAERVSNAQDTFILNENLAEKLEEDHWWPPTSSIDPNIRESEM